MSKNIGVSFKRRDAFDKVTGDGVFTTDLYLPNMLHARVLRSPIAHGKIRSIDTTAAEALPGVKAVATYKNTSKKLFNAGCNTVFTIPENTPVLDQSIFTDTVRYVGDEVAAVAATTLEIASEAIKLIKVEYEELPIVIDPLEAMKPEAPVIHEVVGDRKNVFGLPSIMEMGDFHKGWEESDVTVEVQVKLPIQKPAQMETQAAIASIGGNDEVTVYSTTQTPHPTKQTLAEIFDIPESKIRVLNPPYVGGGFGVRIGFSGKAEPLAVALAQLAGQPVRVEYSREEDFIASDTRHGGYVSAKIGAKKDGTFHAMDLRAIMNGGAYAVFGIETPAILGAVGTNVYRIPHIFFEGYTAYTNIVPAGAMRGFGSPQGAVAIEEAVDKLAELLEMDPIELRLKNILQVGDPWLLPYPLGTTALDECITRARDSIQWNEKRGKGKDQKGILRRGVGIGVSSHVSTAAPFWVDYDACYMRLEGDGSVHLASGTVEIGTATTTSLPQIAAEAVGVPYENVHLVYADTDATPFEIGAHASRSLYSVGLAIEDAAKKIRKDLFEYIGKHWNINPNKLDLVDGMITGLDKPLPIGEVTHHAHQNRTRFLATGQTVPPNAPPWHAHAAEVEVDIETGMVKVIKVAAAHDVGTAINPEVVEGQIEGGVVMGMGYATREEMHINEKGEAYNSGFHRYMLPGFGDTPEIDCILVETHEKTGPYGAKGVGECGMIPTAPAILSAVEDAIGIRFHELPLTPGRVLAGIKKAGLKAE